jgi:hypothetical protein
VRLCCDFQTADAADFADVTLILFCLNLKKKSALHQQNQRHQRLKNILIFNL